MRIMMTAFIAMLITACSEQTDFSHIDAEDLVGVWSLKYTGESPYPYHFSQLAFTKEGAKCVLGYEFDSAGGLSIDYYKNTYQVENGILITTVAYSSGQFGLPEGYVIKDQITHFDSSSFNVFMIEPEGSYAENHQKLHGVNPQEICNVVDQYMNTKRQKTLKKFT